MDSVQYNKRHALERMSEAIEMTGKTKASEIKSFTIKAFFEAKYLEIAKAFTDYYDKSVYRRLAQYDPDHSTTYEEYSKK